MINNWIDEKAIHPLPVDEPHVLAFKKKYQLENKFILMYSGNIGLYYDLENLIKVIEKFPKGTKAADGREVEFAFVGAGTMLQKLKRYVSEHDMKNVSFIPYQPKSDLIYSLNAADVHWCVSAEGIKGVSCPSKFYGIAAAGKPVLGVLENGTEVQGLLEKCSGGYVTVPGNYEEIANNINKILFHSNELESMGDRNRRLIIEGLTKSKSINRYRVEIANLK